MEGSPLRGAPKQESHKVTVSLGQGDGYFTFMVNSHKTAETASSQRKTMYAILNHLCISPHPFPLQTAGQGIYGWAAPLSTFQNTFYDKSGRMSSRLAQTPAPPVDSPAGRAFV